MLKNINVTHGDTQIHNICNVKFLGLITDNTLSWKYHINQLAIKLSVAAYVIRTLSFIMSQVNLAMIYFDYIHSTMSHRIIFWANSAHSNLIFKIQKRRVRMIMKARNRLLNILPFYSQYIFPVSMFVVKNTDIFILNSDIHNIHTRHGSDWHQPTYKLAKA
jgi:hypothetical protein